MKRFSGIIVVLLFLCVDICAQNREVMVWGIPFASSKKDLIAAIQTNAPDAIIVDVRQQGNSLLWRANGFPDEYLRFDGFNVYSAAAEFTSDDKLARAYIGLIPTNRKKVFKLYSTVKKYLTAKYGNPQSDYAFFKSPYHQKGNENNTWAVIEGKCVYSAFWTVPYRKSTITISIEITNDRQVELSFVDEKAKVSLPVKQVAD